MKYLVQILLLINFTFTGSAQNLITNSSFEDLDSCYGQPADIGFDVFEWSGCKGWSCPIASSSDLWCENPVYGNLTPPNVFVGNQNAYSGQNMAGILINDGIAFNYREYIQNELQSVLEKDAKYLIEFYISANGQNCYTNQYGVKFFSNKYIGLTQLWLTDLVPDAVNDAVKFSNDTSIWQKIEMEYTANGTENFVVLGNFQDSLNMTYTLPCDTSFWGSLTLGGGYFFIDDVSITKAESSVSIPNIFTPNGDNVNDAFSPIVVNYPDWKINVLNRWGNNVAILDSKGPIWTGTNMLDGVYYYQFECVEKNKFEQGFITIIR